MTSLGFHTIATLLLGHAFALLNRNADHNAGLRALSVPAPVEHAHMAVHRPADPNWNGTSVQSEPAYGGDYPKDDNRVGSRPAVKVHPVRDADYLNDENDSPQVSVPDFSPVAGHSPEWYRRKCARIKSSCEQRKEAIDRAHESKVHHLEDEYKHDTKILGGMEEQAEESEQVVNKQRTEVREVREDVQEVRRTYERTKNCPAELEKLEDELEELESQPNDSDEAIDEECAKKKEILRTAKCVDKYMEVESKLSRTESVYSSEKETLSEHNVTAHHAAEAVKPYEERADEAKHALDKARRETGLYSNVDQLCKHEVEQLQALADQEVSAAEAEYRRHRKMWESRKEQHEQTEEEVTEQSERVHEEKRRVEEARSTYEAFKDCPAELARAEAQLRELEAVSNDSDEDIDAECHKKKVIMRKRKCTEKFMEAKDVLVRTESVYTSERHELKQDRRVEKSAQTVAEGYEESVQGFEKAWEDAKAAQRAAQECAYEAGSDEESSWGSSKEGPNGGAGMIHPQLMSALAPLFALMLLCL